MSDSFWEANAAAWTEVIRAGTVASRKVTGPAIRREVLRGVPESVLDLGCGEGWLAGELGGGVRYIGCDGSAALIRAARTAHPEAEFIEVPYEGLAAAGAGGGALGGSFDAVVFNFALLGEEIGAALRFARERTTLKGVVLVQTLHPCFALRPYADGPRIEDFRAFPAAMRGEMPWYGRTLASWVREFGRAGLRIVNVVEPVAPAGGEPLSILFRLE